MGKPVVHWELWSKNPEQVSDFYARVFDWKINNIPEMNYHLVDTDSGPISVIVVPDPPEAMGMTAETLGLWSGAVGSNNLVARRVNNFTYCVVGSAPNNAMVKLLSSILP